MAGRPADATAERRFAGRTLIAFAVALAAAGLFAVLLVLVRSSAGGLLRVDRSTTDTLHRFAVSQPSFTSAMRLLSAVGTTAAWAVVMLLVCAWLVYRRLFRLAVFVVVTAAGSILLNNLIKLAVSRARPHLADPVAYAAGKSFPSGHAQAAIVGYGVLVVVFLPAVPRRARGLLVLAASTMVVLIGFSRIALGVHYLSDVIGAFLIGTVWLLGMIAAFRAWRRDDGRADTGLGGGLEPESSDRLAP